MFLLLLSIMIEFLISTKMSTFNENNLYVNIQKKMYWVTEGKLLLLMVSYIDRYLLAVGQGEGK